MVTRYLLPALAVISFTFALVQMTKAQQKPAPASPPVEPAKSPFGKQVAGAGIVEPESENISIGSHLSGVVKAVHVRVEDRVKAGEPLFELDDRQLLAELAAREASLANAKAQLARLEMMPRPEELPPLHAKLAECKANLDDKVAMYDRVKATASVVSIEELNNRKAAAAMALAQYDKAQADLKLSEAGSWKPDTKVAATAVALAQAQLDQTKIELGRLKTLAPRIRRPGADRTRNPIPDEDLVEFKVLQVNVRPGEYVGATQGQAFVVLGTVGKLHIRVDIDENDIRRFKPGMKGVAMPRGNPELQYTISFVRVEPYVIPKKSLTGANTERVDTRVLQVIYAINDNSNPLYVGQQLDVSLNVD
jgi:multidrug efflux pump subunit AcrA (membrane-fusion protein)